MRESTRPARVAPTLRQGQPYRADEAARLLGVETAEVYQLLAAGRLTAVERQGRGRALIDGASLLALVSDGQSVAA